MRPACQNQVVIFSQALAQAILDGAGISLPGGLTVKPFFDISIRLLERQH